MLLKAKEIQEKYRIAHNSLIEWENKGILTPRRTAGGHRRWLEQDIQDLLQITQEKQVKRSEEKILSEDKNNENSTVLDCSPVVHLYLEVENSDGSRAIYTLEEIVELIHGSDKKSHKMDRRRIAIIEEARKRNVGDRVASVDSES
jgi:DNA-binding transcriptional MerR regulator